MDSYYTNKLFIRTQIYIYGILIIYRNWSFFTKFWFYLILTITVIRIIIIIRKTIKTGKKEGIKSGELTEFKS